MEALLLYPRETLGKGPNAFDWWRSCAAGYGYNLTVAFFDEMATEVTDDNRLLLRHRGKVITAPTLAIVRGYDFGLSTHLQLMGSRVVNTPQSMLLSHDKMMTHRYLAAAGIPTPKTVEADCCTSYQEAAAMIGAQRFVVKNRFGSRGDAVFLVSNEQEFNAATAHCPDKMLIQSYVASSHGRDLRLWVVGGKCVGSVLRESADSFLSNYSRGGRATLIDPPEQAATLAQKATQALGLYFAGVDILFCGNGFTICEVNGNAGFRSLSAAGGPDIIDFFFRYLT